MYTPKTHKYIKQIYHQCDCGLLLQDLFSWCYLTPLAKDRVVWEKFSHFSPTHQSFFENCCKSLYLPLNVCTEARLSLNKLFLVAKRQHSAKAEVAVLQQFIPSQRTKSLLENFFGGLCIPHSDFFDELLMFSKDLNPCYPQQISPIKADASTQRSQQPSGAVLWPWLEKWGYMLLPFCAYSPLNRDISSSLLPHSSALSITIGLLVCHFCLYECNQCEAWNNISSSMPESPCKPQS